MVQISNYDIYLHRMSKSYQDKLFFLDKVKDCCVSNILDFGCADGLLIRQIEEVMPDMKCVGYDIDDNMIKLAKRKCSCEFYNNFEECVQSVDPGHTLLNLSSVLHEVYSYSSFSEVQVFWDRVFNSGFKYVAIRDMCISDNADRVSHGEDVRKVLKNADPEQVRDFERIWGSLSSNKNLIHFLLKYRYIQNWKREVNENYLPLSFEKLLGMVPYDKYEVVYSDHYILPFVADVVEKDFSVKLEDNTHVKLLLKRKD